MTSNIEKIEPKSNKELDWIFVTKHELIDRTRKILVENKGQYSPGHHLVKWVTSWEDRVTWEEGYKICIDVLEILYEVNRDIITITHKEWADVSDTDKKLAVWQANMILLTSQDHKKARISLLLEWWWAWDKLVIENPSRLGEDI